MVDLPFRITMKDDGSSIANQAAGRIKRSMKEAGDSIEQMGGAAKAAASIIKTELDKTEAEMQGIARVSDTLKGKLGEAFDGSTADIDQFVGKLRSAGLSFDDIEQEADEFAAAIKRADDIAQQSASRIGNGFDTRVRPAVARTGAEVDKTRSVVANFAGNAAQDLPGVAGSFGAVNVAVGQFAEYMTEGDIAVKRLLASIAPLALVTLGIQQFAKNQQAAAEAAKLHADRQEELTDALVEGDNAAAALADSLEKAGGVKVTILDSIVDITAALNTAGLSASEFTQLVEGGKPKIDEWGQAMLDNGANADVVSLAMIAAEQHVDDLATAQAAAAVKMTFFDTAAQDAARGAGDVATALRGAATAAELSERATEAATQAFGRQADELRAQRDPLFAVVNAMEANEDAQRAAAEAAAEYGATSEEATDANRRAAEAGGDLMDTTLRLRQALEDGTASLDGAKRQLIDMAAAGVITERQAADVARELDNVAFRAAAVRSPAPVNVSITGAAQVKSELDQIITRMRIIEQIGRINASIGSIASNFGGVQASGMTSVGTLAAGVTAPAATSTVVAGAVATLVREHDRSLR